MLDTFDIANRSWFYLARVVVGAVVASFGAYVIGFNWATIPWNTRLRQQGVDRHVSTVPLVGPLLFSIGLACIAWPPSIHIAWCWVIDWPTVLLPATIVSTLRS
jgi:hypothetical protein